MRRESDCTATNDHKTSGARPCKSVADVRVAGAPLDGRSRLAPIALQPRTDGLTLRGSSRPAGDDRGDRSW
jgi:hypothetical protein